MVFSFGCWSSEWSLSKHLFSTRTVSCLPYCTYSRGVMRNIIGMIRRVTRFSPKNLPSKKKYLEVLREGWLYFVWSFPLERVWLWLWCERYKLTVSEKCLKGASSVSLAVWNPKQRWKGLLRDQRSTVQKTFLFLINSNLLNKVYLQVWKCIGQIFSVAVHPI